MNTLLSRGHAASSLLILMLLTLLFGLWSQPAHADPTVVGVLYRIGPGNLQGMSADGRYLFVNGQRVYLSNGAVGQSVGVDVGARKLEGVAVFAMSDNGRYLFFTAHMLSRRIAI